MKKLVVLILVSLFLIGSMAFASQNRVVRSYSFSSPLNITTPPRAAETLGKINVKCYYQNQPATAYVYVYEVKGVEDWVLVKSGIASTAGITFYLPKGKDYAVDAVIAGSLTAEIQNGCYLLATSEFNNAPDPYVWPYDARVYVLDLKDCANLILFLG